MFSQNLSLDSLMLAVVSTGSCVSLQNEIGYPVHHHRYLMQVPMLGARYVWIGSKTCCFLQQAEQLDQVGMASVTRISHFLMYSFKHCLAALKWNKLTQGVSIIFMLLFILFFSPNDWSRNGGWSVGWSSSVTGFPIAWLGSEIFLACHGIPPCLCWDWVCRCDLGQLYTGEEWKKTCIDFWRCLIVLMWPSVVDRILKFSDYHIHWKWPLSAFNMPKKVSSRAKLLNPHRDSDLTKVYAAPGTPAMCSRRTSNGHYHAHRGREQNSGWVERENEMFR